MISTYTFSRDRQFTARQRLADPMRITGTALIGHYKVPMEYNSVTFLQNPLECHHYFNNCHHWLYSNFIPMDSKKLEFCNIDYIMILQHGILSDSWSKKEPRNENMKSCDRQIFEKSRFYDRKIDFPKNLPVTWLQVLVSRLIFDEESDNKVDTIIGYNL